ncbi:NAD(P)/FAD-dependent oxidoreductase [Gammaproteobacteria bacterium]
MKKIIVAGSNFAGLMTIKTLRREGCDIPITMVAPRPEMFYYPAMIWVPAGLYKERDLTFPLDNFIRKYNVEYVAGSVTGLDARARHLYTTAGEMKYDWLVIATGGRSLKQFFGIENVFIPSENYGQVTAMMDRLNSLEKGTLAFGFSGNPKEPTAIRSEPLFEFLFGIDTLLRREKRRDRFNLLFFTSCHELDARWGIRIKGNLMRELKQRDIHVKIKCKIKGFDVDRVITEDGDIKSDLIVFIPQLIGSAWATQSDLPLSEDGFVLADAHCRVLGFEENVYGAGDACLFSGPDWVSKQAHMADLHGKTLARNLVGDIHGKQMKHKFRQEFICIVDTLDGGILAFRNVARSFVFQTQALHWVKRLFIWTYLTQVAT